MRATSLRRGYVFGHEPFRKLKHTYFSLISRERYSAKVKVTTAPTPVSASPLLLAKKLDKLDLAYFSSWTCDHTTVHDVAQLVTPWRSFDKTQRYVPVSELSRYRKRQAFDSCQGCIAFGYNGQTMQ